ncbi:MAG TPA: hypothetical protein VHK67_00880 [Rhabdochlamydiaceae bacterium]|nr:hypothetical protein [Rhabdochlamydiaceae bacterium]
MTLKLHNLNRSPAPVALDAVESKEHVNNIAPQLLGVARVSSGPQVLGRAKSYTNYVNQALEQCKVSASYGISHIYYRVILPLIERVVDLSPEVAASLELYRTHTALCDQVDKVKSAFKAYRMAQKTADNAPLEPADLRKDARKAAQAAGDALATSYDQLIELATRQAAIHQFDKKACLEDIHKELGKKSKDYILQTIIQLQARQFVERGALIFNDYDSSFLQGLFRAFVTDFASRVQAAKNALGGNANPKEIEVAFIRGLASIPELADELTLFEIYDFLSNEEIIKPHKARQLEKIVGHFMDQLAALMDKTENITTEDLESIHCCGITLLSVLPALSADQLNNSKPILKLRYELEQNQKIIKDKTEYSLDDIKAFFVDIGKDMKTSLAEAASDETIVGSFAKAAQQKCEIIKRLYEHGFRKEKELLQEVAIEECAGALTKMKEEVTRLDGEILKQQEAILRMESELIALTEEYNLAVKQLPESILMKQLLRVDVLRKGYEEERDQRDAEIKTCKELWAKNTKEREIQQEALERESAKLSLLNQTASDNSDKAQELMVAITKQIKELHTNSVICLSGEEIVEIAKHLGVESPSSPRSRMAIKLNQTNTAVIKVSELAKKISDAQANIKDSEQLNDQSFTICKDGKFLGHEDGLFGEKKELIVNKIKTHIEVNFAVAKDVTLAVIGEVVRQEDEFANSQQHPKTKMSHQQLLAAERISPLKAELLKRNRKPNLLKTNNESAQGLCISTQATSAQNVVKGEVFTDSSLNRLGEIMDEGYAVADNSL